MFSFLRKTTPAANRAPHWRPTWKPRLIVLEDRAVPSTLVYANDFESNAAGFNVSARVSRPNGAGTSTFLGPFTSQPIVLSLSGLTAGTRYSVSFDLYIGLTWDGNGSGTEVSSPGGDQWTLTADGTPLVDTTFTNHPFAIQSYADENPVGFATNLGTTGADATNVARDDSFDVEVFKRSYAIYSFGHGTGNPTPSFVAGGGTAQLTFRAPNDDFFDGLDLGFGEYWAIDNVQVSGAAFDVPTVTVTGGSFTYDGQPHPATGTVTGAHGEDLGALTFTYNGSAAPPVNAGTYAVVASFAGNDHYLPGSAETTITIARATPVFSNLSAPTITVGTAATVLAGTIDLGPLVPSGSVLVTLDGVTRAAAIGPGGAFSVGFAAGSLAAGSYAVGFNYAGNGNFTAADGTSVLRVRYNTALFFDNTRPVHSGATLPIKLRATDANGGNLSSAGLAVQAVGVIGPNGQQYPPQDAGNSNPGGFFRYDPSLGGYIFNLKTTGLAAGDYTFTYRIGDDPTLHFLTFTVW